MVVEGLLAALADEPRLAAHAGILVDATLGPGVAERAHANGVTVSMPLERGGCEIYETEPADLRSHLEHHGPELPKVLVRYNVEGDVDGNRVQRARLAEVSTTVRDTGGRFLFELLVPPTPAQLDAVGGDPGRFDFGITYLARHASLGREVAIKEICRAIWRCAMARCRSCRGPPNWLGISTGYASASSTKRATWSSSSAYRASCGSSISSRPMARRIR